MMDGMDDDDDDDDDDGSSLVSIRQTDVTSSDLRWTSSVYASASYRKNKYGGHCLV